MLDGFSAELTPAEVAEVRADPRVEAVVPDGRVHASGNQLSPPWGLDRIDQRSLPLDRGYGYQQTGAGVTAFVIDTGIRATHTQFGGRVSSGSGLRRHRRRRRSRDCEPAYIGDGGHGTHVAGIIGGRTYGVAKASAWCPVRVLDCDGGGWHSDVIAGLDWVGPAQARRSVGDQPEPRWGASDGTGRCGGSRRWPPGIPVVVAAGNGDRSATASTPA